MTSDLELLQDYARKDSEESFAALVNRHLNLVYSAALRQVRSPQLAEEVAQAVFVDLSQNAGKLRPDTILTAWLYLVTRRTAIDVVRREARRQLREHIASEMNAMNATEASWTHIEPILDEAMEALDETDRAAVLLRYFENRSLRDVGLALGTSDDAAQKRVSRAVERLREFFAKRGVTVGAGGLAVVISANAVQAAPVGLTATITTAAVVTGTTLATTAAATAAKTMAMTTVQKTLVTATVALLAGAGIYEAHQASRLRDQVETLQQRQTPLAEQVAALKTENERLSNQVAQARKANALSQAELSELLKLRGQSTAAQFDARELAQLKALLAEPNGNMPDYLTNALKVALSASEKFMKKEALAELARMKEKLNFTPDQELAVSNILMMRVERQSQMGYDRMIRRPTPEQLAEDANAHDREEGELKAMLTPEQLASYPEYVQQEKTLSADRGARSQASYMARKLELSDAQQEAVRRRLYEKMLEDRPYQQPKPITEALRAGRPAEAVQAMIELQTSKLEERLKMLGDILTPEQANAYREEEMILNNMHVEKMKWDLQLPPAGTTN